jgi:hypothetical protein
VARSTDAAGSLACGAGAGSTTTVLIVAEVRTAVADAWPVPLHVPKSAVKNACTPREPSAPAALRTQVATRHEPVEAPEVGEGSGWFGSNHRASARALPPGIASDR